jgi:uncharacterized protein YfaS (alpha-2-macroglobulin family)
MIPFKSIVAPLCCLCLCVAIVNAYDTRNGRPARQAHTAKTSIPRIIATMHVDSSNRHIPPRYLQITFNTPMIAVTSPSDQVDIANVTITPPIQGNWRWIGTTVLEFTPAISFQNSTEYVVSVKKGFRSAITGKSLHQPFSATFSTERFCYLSASNSSPYGFVQKVPFYVQFNQGVELRQCRQALSFTPPLPVDLMYADSAECSYLRIHQRRDSASQTFQDRVIKIIPTENWLRNTTYRMTIKNGLMPKTGNCGLAKDTVITIQTVGDLVFTGMWQRPDKWITTDSIAKPEQPIGFNFSNYIDWKKQWHHFRSTPAIPFDTTSFGGPNNFLAFDSTLAASTNYTVTFDSQLTDMHGNRLSKQVVKTFTTTPFKPFLHIIESSWNMESRGHRSIPVYYCNRDSLQLDMLVLPVDVALRWQQSSGLQSEARFDTLLRRAQHDGWPTQQIRTVPDTTHNQYHRWILPLDTVLRGKPGFVAARLLTPYDTSAKKDGTGVVNHCEFGDFLISNIALSIQEGNGEYHFIATRLDSGRPIPGATISVRDTSGKTLWTGTTATDGRAAIGSNNDFWKNPRSEDYSPLFVVANSTNEWVYKEISAFSDANRTGRILPVFSTAFVDRGLYLPGDTVRFTGIVRAEDDTLVVPGNCRVGLSVSDYNLVQRRDTVPLSEVGISNYAFTIPHDAVFGQYTIFGRLLKNDTTKAGINGSLSASFIVGEFRTNTVALTITTQKDNYFWGDTVTFRVCGRYLYDAPFAGAGCIMNLGPTSRSFSPLGFDGYTFSFDANYTDTERFNHQQIYIRKLDSAGILDFTIPLVDSFIRGGYGFAFYCDASSKHTTITASKAISIHPGTYYIGLKPRLLYGSVGEPHSVDVATIAVSGKPLAVENLTVGVFRNKPNPYATSDTLVWQSKVSTNTFGIGSFHYTPLKSGDYTIIVSGTPQRIASSTKFTVYGDVPGWDPDQPALSLNADKPEYEIGDTVRILLTNILRKGRALITTEREHILTAQWADITPDRTVLKIPVLPVHLSGFWVSVTAYYGGKTVAVAVDKKDEQRGPQCETQERFVKVNWHKKALTINLRPDKNIYAPGDSVILQCDIPKVKKTGHEVIVWAEDEGVLALTGYQPPDILDAMYASRHHDVSASDSRSLLLKPFTPMYEGGPSLALKKRGCLSNFQGKSLNTLYDLDFLNDAKTRKRFSISPLFASAIKLDSNGRATLRFKLPDNLTQFRIMAIAATADGRFGNADTSIIVTKPLLLLPVVPQFVRCRDTLQLGVVIENRTDGALENHLRFTGTGVTFTQAATGTISIPPHERRDFFVSAVVDSFADSLRMVFQTAASIDSDAVVVTLPVSPYRFPETITTCGTIDNQKREKVRRPVNHDLFRSTLGIEVTNTIVKDLKGSLRYLDTYQYDCAEQITSKIVPYLLCEDVFKKEAVSSFPDSIIYEKIEHYLRELPQYKSHYMGYSYWKNGAEFSPYLTAYILFTLFRATDCGYTVPSELIENCIYGLITYLRNPDSKSNPPLYPEQCYVAGVLAEYGRHQPTVPKAVATIDSLVNALLLKRSTGSLFCQINLLRAIRYHDDKADIRKEIVDRCRSEIVHEPLYAYFDEPDVYDVSPFHQSHIRTTAMILQTFLELGEELPFADKIVRWLLLQKRAKGHWGTTQNNMFALWALATFARTMEPPAANAAIEVTLDNKPILQHTFSTTPADDSVAWQRSFSAIPKRSEHRLRFERSGVGNLYYTLQLNCLSNVAVLPFDAGFRIEKTYTTLAGKPVSLDSLTYREIVLVKTVVTTPRERNFVVIDDPIPAGCEIINEAFNTVEKAVAEGIRSRKRTFYCDWSTWNHFEYRKEGCRVFATRLRAGNHEFVYAIRPISRGAFHLPPAQVEEMYSPEVYGRTGERMAVVR